MGEGREGVECCEGYGGIGLAAEFARSWWLKVTSESEVTFCELKVTYPLRSSEGVCNLGRYSLSFSIIGPTTYEDGKRDVSDITKAPEIEGGRAKMLHPAVQNLILPINSLKR
jgi:hypothetical protein